MSGKDRKIKNVSFSLKDEFEAELLDYAEKPFNGKKRDFSKFVKRLIAEEKKRNSPGNDQGYNPAKLVDNHISEETNFDTPDMKEAMGSFFTKGV